MSVFAADLSSPFPKQRFAFLLTETMCASTFPVKCTLGNLEPHFVFYWMAQGALLCCFWCPQACQLWESKNSGCPTIFCSQLSRPENSRNMYFDPVLNRSGVYHKPF
jgi:hypothetical protein